VVLLLLLLIFLIEVRIFRYRFVGEE